MGLGAAARNAKRLRTELEGAAKAMERMDRAAGSLETFGAIDPNARSPALNGSGAGLGLGVGYGGTGGGEGTGFGPQGGGGSSGGGSHSGGFVSGGNVGVVTTSGGGNNGIVRLGDSGAASRPFGSYGGTIPTTYQGEYAGASPPPGGGGGGSHPGSPGFRADPYSPKQTALLERIAGLLERQLFAQRSDNGADLRRKGLL